jgi:hypothetical protein
MLKLKKSEVTCSYCLKIYKDPIDLPCGDSICRQHLSVKQNKITCNKCNGEFQLNDDAFRSNKNLKKQVENQSYLSDEEINLEQKLEESIKKFFQYYDEFSQNKNKIETDVFDHFQELRFQIDEQREELTKRIDDIALAMIDKIKKYEEKYLRDLKERFPFFGHSQSLESELNQIEDTFRNPNLLAQSIKEMQSKQEASLKEIQIKLNQMTTVKYQLKTTKGFKPNLSSFNQEEGTSLFGSLKLDGCWLNVNSFKGQILTDVRQMTELIDLCGFSPNDKWTLLYRGTRDGFGSRDFHSKCDGHSNTLTILKVKGSEFIFGGFTTVNWDSSNGWKSDLNAFIFSLTNKDNQPLKMKIEQNRHRCAICCYSFCGPTFGYDIRIANNANTTTNSYSDLGFSYSHPQYAQGTNEVQTFLAGSYKFQLAEIEVYQKE